MTYVNNVTQSNKFINDPLAFSIRDNNIRYICAIDRASTYVSICTISLRNDSLFEIHEFPIVGNVYVNIHIGTIFSFFEFFSKEIYRYM